MRCQEFSSGQIKKYFLPEVSIPEERDNAVSLSLAFLAQLSTFLRIYMIMSVNMRLQGSNEMASLRLNSSNLLFFLLK